MEKDVKGFCKFEAENDLFSRKYLGFPYWQLVRFNICESIFSEQARKTALIKQSKSKLGIIAEVLKQICFAAKSHLAMREIEEHELIVFRSSNQHELFFESLTIPKSINRVEIRGSNDFDAINYNDTYNILMPFIQANISYIVKKRFGFLRRDLQEREFIDYLVTRLQNKFGQCLSAEEIEQLTIRYTEYCKFYTPYFEKMFARVNCKALLVVCYYQVPLMIAYEVAKRKGILIIELQHGLINSHEEYWFEDQRGIHNHTPDYFLAFGDQHIEWTKMLPTTLCLPVGNPYQEYYINKWSNVITNEKVIVIYPTADLCFETVVNEFVDFIITKGYKVFMKIHPGYEDRYKVYYPILSQNKGIEVITDQSKGIYYWLKLGRHHIMADTTVGFEALAFPHTNICIATHVDHQQLQPLLDWNCARGFCNATELLKLIECPYMAGECETRERLWKKDGAKNIEHFFEYMSKRNWPSARECDIYID